MTANPIVIESDDQIPFARMDAWLAKSICEELNRCYPQHPWRVHVDQRSCVAQITHGHIRTDMGYTMHTVGKSLHDLQMQARMAGGEILERFGLARGKVDGAALMALKRDAAGRAQEA